MKRIISTLLSISLLTITFSQSCIDFSNYTTAYVDSVTGDNVNFPAGTTFISEGDLELKKMSNSFYQGIQGDSTLFYIGDLLIDVSGSSCSNKILTFKSAYTEEIIVDGDTISQFTTPPSFYQGNGFTFQFTGQGLGSGSFTISGDFDTVYLLTSTNFLWDICLNCQTSAPSCLDFSLYTTAYVDSVTQDDTNFPDGSAFIAQGGLEIIKMPNGIYQGIQGDTALFYIGDLAIDVSSYNCSNKQLTFTTAYTEEMIIDGDTIYQFVTPPAFYQGNGFTFEFVGSGLGSGVFTITGDFDVVTLLTQTNFLSEVCLTCLNSVNPTCLDLSNYTTAYIDSAGQDNVNFPVGSTIVGNGAIEVKKIDLSTIWMGLQGDSALFYIGNTELDVSGYNCSNKRLTFMNSYAEQMIIDGDTVYSFTPPGAFYQGNGFTVTFNGSGLGSGEFIIEGDFDVVRLLGSTNVIWNMCIDCITNNPVSCLDFSQYDNAYVDSVTQDNLNFPPGTAFMTQGDIQIVKIDNMSFFQGIQGDSSLFYIGNLAMDVSTMNCNNKKLTFKVIYVEHIAINGDTLAQLPTPTSFYQGNGYTLQYDGNGQYTVTGDFDVVTLLSQTNFLWDVCLECLTTASIEQEESIATLELLLYPNPTSGLININFPEKENYEIHVLDAQGRLFNTQQVNGENHQLDLSSSPNGIYFVHVLSKKGWQMTKKVVKN
ncbi:MAG: T9SS type A sorting domain-containing protein [Crocinitomicaceae bacterium]|nr:T9SS type A sorting domain-containing protein [Crocinitomicaceae bacterium]